MCNRHHHTTPLHDQGVKACTQPYASMSMCEGTTLYLPLIPSTPRIPNSSHGSLHVTYMLDHANRPDPVPLRQWQLYNTARSCWTVVLSKCSWESMSQCCIIDVNSCITDVQPTPSHYTASWPRRQGMHSTLCFYVYVWRYDIILTIDSINTTNTKQLPRVTARHLHAGSCR